MKIILTALLGLFHLTVGCQTTANKNIDPVVLKTIKQYYHDKYGDYNNEYGINAEKHEKIEDSILSVNYSGVTKDGYSDPVISLYIPLKNNFNLYGSNPILYGDINNDNKKDLVVVVHKEGEGGGNNYAQDILIFINTGNSYKLTSVNSDRELSDCTGYLRINAIKDNTVITTSSCYGDGDPRCCPSLIYTTILKYNNSKLEFFSKTEKTK